MLVSRQSRNQKKSINKIVLPGGAAEMRLARLFQSEELHPADHRSTTFATRDTSRATRTDTEQHSKLFRENRHQHELTYAQRRAAPPTRQPSQMKRDLTVCPVSCSHLCQWASSCPLILISRYSGF